MSKAMKFIIPLVAVLGIAGVLMMIKKDLHVERSKVINANVAVIQNQIVDFKNFTTWSPWAELDPDAKHEFKGEQGKVGAEFHWSGNNEVGTGYQKVVAISEERIDIDLIFTAPWSGESKVYYLFEEVEGGTKVTWAYDGELDMLTGLFMNMDEMLGGMYMKGLNSLSDKLSKTE